MEIFELLSYGKSDYCFDYLSGPIHRYGLVLSVIISLQVEHRVCMDV